MIKLLFDKTFLTKIRKKPSFNYFPRFEKINKLMFDKNISYKHHT